MGPEFQFMRALAGATKFFKAAKIAFYIYAGVSAVKSWREASALMKEGQDVLATKHPAGGKLPILYGTRRIGSTIVYMDTDSGNSKELFVVYALSVGEIDDIDLGSIELNGVSIRDSKVFRQGYYAGSDKIVSGAGSLNTASQIGNVQESNAGTSGTDPTKRYRMVFNAHHGSSTQTADPMLTASITKWTTSHRLRGIAYIAASFEYDSRGMFTSTPELTVVCRGKKLYDPRLDGSISGGTGSHRIDDTSTYEWSDNAALAILDYITNTEYGKGLAASAIDMSSFQAAANITDTKVDVPDFSGSYASATYTGNSGNNYFDVDEATWKKIKGGSVITLKDSDTTTELEDAIVTDVQRYTPHTETTKYRIYTNSTLGANYSNEAGTILVKTRRFHCNGLLDADKTVLENTRTLVSNCRAFFNYLNGKFSIKIEDTGSSTFSITEDHIVDDSGITINYEDKAEKYNKVVVNFFNAQKKYEADTVTIYHDASPNYTSDDGGEELEAQAELNFVTNPYIAYNIGKAILGRSRNQKAISFTATPALFRLSVGDIVDITYSGLGLSADNYIIQSISLEANGLLNVTALEYVDIYTWDSASDAENVGDLPDLPTGLEAIPPTNLTFTDSDSSSTGRPFLSWTAATNYPAKEFRVVIVDSSDNELHNRIVSNAFIDLNFIPVGSNYEASVSSINSLGSESDAATLTFSVGTEPVATTDVQDSAVTTGKINDSAVTTGKINDSAVTSGKLADGAVTSLKLADDAVTNAKLAVDSIQGDVIAAGAITTTKLADDAVTNAKIAVDAIQGDVIAAGAITTTKLGANAVTTAKLANDAVTSDIIAASAVTTTEISDNAVSTAKLIAGSVTTAKIATGAVTANEIAANTITAGEIAAGAINTDELAANAVTAAKIAANTITASQIAAGTITANEIATDTITAANIAAGAIDTSELAANAVTAAKIAANTITASQIAAGTITTTQIAAGTIAASNIATGTLTSASGVFGAISAGDISTGSLTSTNHSGTGDGSDFSTAGTKINIADGSVSSENFRISSAGDAFFRGQVTAGSGVSTVAIGADSGSNINIFAGATTPDSATFKVDSTGKVTLTSLILKTGGNTYFDENGFTDYAITQILQGTGTTVGSYAYSQSDNTSYATITTTDAVTVDLTASLDMSQILGDNSYSTSALAKAQIPEDMTLIIEVAEDDNTFGSPLHGSTSSQFTADTTGVFQPDPSDGSGVTSSEYHVSAFGFFGVYTASISPTFGAVDSNSNMSISLSNVSLSANTTYYFRFRLTTTDTNYDLENNLTIPTATRTLNIAAQSGGFVVASGGGSGSGTSADSFQRISVSGQSTIIADATNSNNLTIAAGSGIALTTNASTDTLTIAASGSPTFTDLTVTGNLTVQGTTTTLETATLNVEDKNITLNYGTGDTSASANGAGITIQDAVNSTTDATILWNTTSDEFDFSHGIDVTGTISSTYFTSSGNSRFQNGTMDVLNIQPQAAGSGVIAFITNNAGTAYEPLTIDFETLALRTSGTPRLSINSSGNTTFAGNVTATAFYGDGSNLTGITGTGTTINNNADNRIITGSGTANTLNAESGLTYDGSTLAVTGAISSGAITSTGINNSSAELIDLDNSTYLILKDPQGSAGIYIGGTGDINNYYDSNNHFFRSKTGGTLRTLINTDGVDAKFGGFRINGTTVIDSSRNLTNIGSISASSGYLIMGEAAYSVSSDYVGIKTSNQSGTSDYMIISGKTDGNTYVSAKAGSNTHIRGGANSATHELIVSSSAATFSGTVQISAGQKLLFGGNTIYGIGAGGHNYNSGYFDTVESGVSTDVLELVYYSGTQVNIGSSGGTKPLSAGSIQITGTTVINSSRDFQNVASIDLFGALYQRNNLLVLNAAGNGWNTWATRTAAGINNLSNIGTISSGAITTAANYFTVSPSSGEATIKLDYAGSTSNFVAHGGWGMGANKVGIGDGSQPTLVVDNVNDRIGVGTGITSPTHTLDVGGNISHRIWRGKLDRGWGNYPSITIDNTTDQGPQGEFRIHGAAGANGGDFSIDLRLDGAGIFSSSVYSPIYYDSDNTAYYLNPNGSSYLANANVVGAWYFYSGGNPLDSAGPALQAYATNSTSGAWMSFHRPSIYAINMGLDTNNNFVIGGWSSGARLNIATNGTTTFYGALVCPSEIIANTDGAVILKCNTSEANQWIYKENVPQWGMFYFNKGSQSGATVGAYTTIGAETFFTGSTAHGPAMPSTWTGYQSGSYLNIMLSHYSGYIYSGSTVEAKTSMRTPIYYDNDDTGYYADFNVNTTYGQRFRSGTLYGPNPTWGAYLYVGTNGNVSGTATVAATNGNLHLDGATASYPIYLNYYTGGDIITRTMRDADNSSYYLDSSGTSNFNLAYFAGIDMVRGSSYNENIRCHANSNDYSSFVLGAIAGNSGTGTGQWTLVRFPSAYSYKFTIRHNSTDHLTIDTSGNGTFTGNVTAYSDERLKTNIKTIENSLDKVKSMRGVTYERDGKAGSGVIAQELEKIAPELIFENNDEMKTKSVAYGNLVGYLIEGMKQQQEQIELLKQEIANIKGEK